MLLLIALNDVKVEGSGGKESKLSKLQVKVCNVGGKNAGSTREGSTEQYRLIRPAGRGGKR